MAIRTANNPYDPTVDKLIGDAYEAVKRVATDIAYIKHVSHHLKNVYEVSESLEAIIGLLDILQDEGKLLPARRVVVIPTSTGLIGGTLQDVLESFELRLKELENK